MTPAPVDVWRSYLESSILLQTRLDDALRADGGMSLLEYHLLLLLHEAPEHRLRMGELARAMVFSSSRLSYQVDVLERRGWVRRLRGDTDARVVHACLTEAGNDALRSASRPHLAAVRELFLDDLSPQELQELAVVFGRLAVRLREPEQ